MAKSPPLLDLLSSPSPDTALICRRLVRGCLDAARKRDILKVPEPAGLLRRIENAPFHPSPELFIQISGATGFAFPEDKFRLLPGEVCIVPRFMPHGETAINYHGPFHNMVFIHRSDILIAVNLTVGRGGGKFGIITSETFNCPDAGMVFGYLQTAAEKCKSGSPRGRAIASGLLTAALSRLEEVFMGSARPLNREEPYKVAQCKRFVMNNLYDTGLCVKQLAQWIKCAPDYLSHIFHRATGEPLSLYINRNRVERARAMLASTSLNVSETAWACGYADPGYFARVFRRHTGQTPRQYRKRAGG